MVEKKIKKYGGKKYDEEEEYYNNWGYKKCH